MFFESRCNILVITDVIYALDYIAWLNRITIVFLISISLMIVDVKSC